MLVLAVVLAPALRRGEREPVADVADLRGPAAVELGAAVATVENVR